MANYRCMGCMKEFDDSLKRCPHCSYIVGSLPAEPYFLAPETVLDGRYIVGRVLGSSPLTITYLAWDCLENCKIVIKEYFPTNFSSRMPGQKEINTYDGEKAKQFESGLRAFIAENTKLTQLPADLEGVAHTKEVFIENSTAYTVTEHLEGISFAKVISDNRIPWNDVVKIMMPVIASLESIHKFGLIHYNISPDNIIMTRDRKIKLLSFGSAKLEAVGNIKNLDLITKPGFSPAELYSDDPTGSDAVDVYSIAAIMYYAITGVVPKPSIERASGDTLKTPKELGISIPANIENALMNALNVNAQNRTPDCATFMAELSSERVVRRVEAKKKEDTGKLTTKFKVIIGVCLALVIAAVTAIALTQSEKLKGYSGDDGLVCPDLIGYTQEKLAAEDEKYDNLTFVITDTLEDASAEPGTVLWQSIEPYTKLDEDENIIIEVKLANFVSEEEKESDTIKMPSLFKGTRDYAEKILSDYGLTNYSFQTRNTTQYENGTICDQSVEAGEEIDKDEHIIIYIARNDENQQEVKTTRAPQVVNTTKAPKPSNPKPNGNQSNNKPNTNKPNNNPDKPADTTKPAITTTLPQTTATPKLVSVPNVVGMAGGAANASIRSSGLNPINSPVATTDESLNGKVKSTSPGAGAQVAPGANVTVYVYSYQAPADAE